MNVVIRRVNGVVVEYLIDGVPQPLDSAPPSQVYEVRPKPVTPEEWPLILRSLKLLAKPNDSGLGDIIERHIGPIGGDAFKRWYEKTFGRPCGCDTRKESWNRKFPLGEPQNAT